MLDFEQQEPPNYSILRMNCLMAIHGRMPRRTTYPSGLPVFVPQANLSALADVSVYTEPQAKALDHCATNPTLLLEVVAGQETKGKFPLFKMAPSLQEYVAVDVESYTVTCRRRGSEGTWDIERFEGEQAIVNLACLGLRIPLQEIYRSAIIDGKCEPS